MKKILYIVALALAFVSCSDKVYEEINTDPTKADSINPASQLTYAELQMYGDMTFVDTYRLYTYAFTQHLMGCWNTTNYGGQHRANDNEMSRPWSNLYPGAIRNLTDAIDKTKNDPSMANLQAALRIFRVYVSGLLTDFYGDIPYSEAGLGYITGNTRPVYDKQSDIYYGFFEELKDAAKLFNSSANKIDTDPLFEGDIQAWKTFANSLRLRYAMRISEVNPTKAQEEIQAALADGVMTSKDGNACVKHMNITFSFGQDSYKDFRGNALSKYFYGNDPTNHQSYICTTFWDALFKNNDPRTSRICHFYIDDYMATTSPEGRIDMTDAVIATQIANPDMVVVQPNDPGCFSYSPWPNYPSNIAGSELAIAVEEVQKTHPEFNPNNNPRWLRPKLANNFMQSDNPGVLMTYAEVCFLQAEAAARSLASGDAKSWYEEGIRQSMEFLYDYYKCVAIPADAVAAYLQEPNIKWADGDLEKQLEQINTQAWILHFHNPAEAWANVRRSGYPKLLPPAGTDEYPIIDGAEIPVRLCYPLNEERYNGVNYNEAKSRVTGTYDWHASVWWDVK